MVNKIPQPINEITFHNQNFFKKRSLSQSLEKDKGRESHHKAQKRLKNYLSSSNFQTSRSQLMHSKEEDNFSLKKNLLVQSYSQKTSSVEESLKDSGRKSNLRTQMSTEKQIKLKKWRKFKNSSLKNIMAEDKWQPKAIMPSSARSCSVEELRKS